jgi:hypothetical protein
MQMFLHWVRKDGIQGEPYEGIENKDLYWNNKPTPEEYKNHYEKQWSDILYKPGTGVWGGINKKSIMDEYNMNPEMDGTNLIKNKYNKYGE